ncbi:MAG: hypothetical protein ACPGNV_06145 [Mangrovicoccus sp.]
MDNYTLIAAVAAALFGCFAFGFMTHWLLARLTRVSDAELSDYDAMAEALHQAEMNYALALKEIETLRRDSDVAIGELRAELALAREQSGADS